MVKLFHLRRISILSTFCFLGILFLTNCSKEEQESDPKPQEPILSDAYTYTALRNDGTIFEIGDETGEIKKVGEIPEITFNIAFNTVTSSENTTYMYEQMPEIFSGDGTTTGFRGQLCELNNKSLSSKCTILDFSNNVFPEFAGLIALDWDNENKRLVGVVGDVVNVSKENPNYLIHIDPQTLLITYTGIQFVQGFINSTCLVGNTYYISSRYDNSNNQPIFSSLDLSIGSQNTISTSNLDSPPIILSKNKDAKKLFGLAWEFNTGFTNAAIPVAFDIVSQKFEKLPFPTRISFKQDFGKSYFNADSGEQIALVNSEMGGLLRYNFQTKIFKLVHLSPSNNELSSLVAIINVK
ncbi:hypothetical protein DHD32_20650 [Arenibacter sp. TNZ]|jgi:hypothetical protein|uniref:hypothetical protein n=1 Tax=Arenibacter TaxID=178469 RepID=UPI000CD497D9|nr:MULTISPECIES: hypothetical protein [Arenibacter]MCM4173883.1 hypothetical protein [Arenibacter sp. TNZ]